MAFLARIRSFWRNALHRSDMERDMSNELQFHLVRRAEDLIERRGLPPDEAMRIARLEFGSVEKYKEEARQSLGLKLVDETGGDLRYAFRSFAKNKAFTLAAVGTLALGIGANTAIFSLMDAVLVRQLLVERPEELVLLLRQQPGQDPDAGFTSNPDREQEMPEGDRRIATGELPAAAGCAWRLTAAAAEALFTTRPVRLSQAPAVLGHHQGRQLLREPHHRSVVCVG